MTDTISIRMATPDDGRELVRLATLDAAEVPCGPVLLAERDGQLQAALAVADGRAIADPFAPTAELVALLRVRAKRLQPASSVLVRLGGALQSRRRNRAYAA